VQAPLDVRKNARKRTAAGVQAPVPATSAERTDFSWVPHLTDIVPGIGGVKPELLGDHPPASLVAARFRLRAGSVITYSMIRVDGKVRPIHFRAGEKAQDVPYAQALANWVEAEIRVPGDAVELVEKNFETGKTRTIKLRPENNVVELAVLNLPPFNAPAPDSKPPLPKPGQHFEVYYDFVTSPPARGNRPVPHLPKEMKASDPQVDWVSVANVPWSELLEQLGMSARGKKKSPYDISLCPGSQLP
jgi:hypothetical protein